MGVKASGKRRLACFGILLLVSFLGLDQFLAHVILPRHWRPMPPFGVLTNPGQQAWLEQQEGLDKTELAGRLGRFDPLLGWSLNPNCATAEGRVHTNSRGWRGTREYPERRPEGMLRLVACGDSFTFSEEVADQEAWPAQLESLWPRAEVINLGVGGYGTDQALLRLSQEDPGPDVDAVLIGLMLENLGRNVNRYRPRWYPRADSPVAKPRFVIGADTLELIPIPYETRGALLRSLRSGQVLDDLSSHEYWQAEHLPAAISWSGFARWRAGVEFYGKRTIPSLFEDPEAEPFRVTLRVLAAFAEFARSPDGRRAKNVIVLIFPPKEEFEHVVAGEPRCWQGFVEALANKKLATIDLTDALLVAEEMRDPGSPSLWADSHLSARGNAVVAQALYPILQQVLEP